MNCKYGVRGGKKRGKGILLSFSHCMYGLAFVRRLVWGAFRIAQNGRRQFRFLLLLIQSLNCQAFRVTLRVDWGKGMFEWK